jgi:hypothetical protein
MITTFDLTSPETQINSQIPSTGDSWEQSLSVGHLNVGERDLSAASKAKKKERAPRKDKGVPRKRKDLQAWVLTLY